MARTLSITDDDTGITAKVRIDESTGAPRIVSVHLDAAEGYTITAADLRGVEQQFGLTLPAAAAAPPPAAVPAAAPTKRQHRAAATAGSTVKRTTAKQPTDEVLAALYARTNGSTAVMATQLGAAQSTVGQWVRQARRRGAPIPEAALGRRPASATPAAAAPAPAPVLPAAVPAVAPVQPPPAALFLATTGEH